MLNLSDKELDRLSREAADHHDPGDLFGPRAWDRLELHLDKDLGQVGGGNNNPLRGIKRFPFHYASALVLVAGVTWFAVKQANKPGKAELSGSPPVSAAQADPKQTDTLTSLQIPDNAYKTTSTPEPNNQSASTATASSATVNTGSSGSSSAAASSAAPATSGLAAASAAPASSKTAAAPATSTTGPSSRTFAASASARPGSSTAPASASTGPSVRTGSPAIAVSVNTGSSATNNIPGTSAPATGMSTVPSSSNTAASHAPAKAPGASVTTAGNTGNTTTVSPVAPPVTGSAGSYMTPATGNARNTQSAFRHSHSNNSNRLHNHPGTTTGKPQTDWAATTGSPLSTPGSSPATAAPSVASAPARSSVRSPQIGHPYFPRISDSALRAYHPESTAAAPPKGPALKINRGLEIGFLLAPDFASVNALAGDRPGSSVGLTLDYQILNKLHIGTGALYSKKIYTARIQDYHVSHDYLRMNGLNNVDFVKGSISMLEIPLEARYDFSVTGNTLIFASIGTSSYFLPSEHTGYYFDHFGMEVCRNFKYNEKNVDLFSTLNFSLGVEAGLSNSVSLVLAPYVKTPTGNIGFGAIRMNSVGINFGLRYAPVLSRKRH